MTHVFVDARNITERPAGVARYAMALLPRMIAATPEWEWSVLRHASNQTPMFDAEEIFVHEPIDSPKSFALGSRVFRGALRGRSPDVLHSLFHLLPRNSPKAGRTIVTVHDFIWIDHPEISQRSRIAAATTSWFARRAIPYALKQADHVIAVSQATADRATQWVPREKISLVHHGVEPTYFEPPPPSDAIVDYLRADGWRYIAAVGNDKYYKNLHTLVRAFAAIKDKNTRLVLVGSCDGLKPLAEALGVSARVVHAGFLDDDDLRRVLGNASVFVFPSLVEGFGLPPLEAMALGVPTIVSRLEPMHSIAGDAALQFEPTDVQALAVLVNDVLDDPRLAESLRTRGLKRARRFDWDRTADLTLATYGV